MCNFLCEPLSFYSLERINKWEVKHKSFDPLIKLLGQLSFLKLKNGVSKYEILFNTLVLDFPFHSFFNMNFLQGFKRRLKSISCRFEFYCFILFKMQIRSFLAKYHEFGSRGIWNTIYPIYVLEWYILPWNEWFYYINREYRISNTPETKFMKFGQKLLQFAFWKE